MRIAYVCADPGVPVFGQKGCSIHVQEMLGAFLRLGVRIELFAARLGGSPPPALQEVRVHLLPSAAKGPPAQRERAAREANHGMLEQLEREGPFDLVYERYSLWSFSAMEYARSISVPGLLEVNAPLIDEQERHRGLVDRPAAERVAARVFGAATTLLPVSREVAAYLNGYPIDRNRVHVISNAVNPDRFLKNRQPPTHESPRTFTVGFVGSLKRWHGVDLLLEAFATLHRQDAGTRLLIVGEGPERAALTESLSAKPPELQEAVRFTGAVLPNAIPGLLNTLDVAVVPYPALADFYFSPLKVYEYMAAGLPVVASSIGELARLIKDEGNGLLVPPGDRAALTAALARLRSDPALCARLGLAARQTMHQGHTWDNVVDRIFQTAGLDPRNKRLREKEIVG